MDNMLEHNDAARQKAKEIHDLARQITAMIHAEHHRPTVRFTLEPGEPGIFESKAGGTPYLPREVPWPQDAAGKCLDLLAQVDCAGLGGLPDFPHTGLLQFFTAQDNSFGMSYPDLTNNAGFRVLYYETVDFSVTAEKVKAKHPPRSEDDENWWWYHAVLKPCRIVLSVPVEQGMNRSDPCFETLFVEQWNRLRPNTPIKCVSEIYGMMSNRMRDYTVTGQPNWDAPYHQLGGYPYFTQEDPRPGLCDDLDVLLFQLDSEMTQSSRDLVRWGDCGVGNFFINREALKKRDFSRVAYTWDCC